VSTDTKLDLLAGVPLFSRLDKDGLRQVAQLADEIDLPAGKVLTHQGASAHEFFLVLQGTLSVERDGKEVATMKEGDFFGEIGLLDRAPRTATVTANTPVRVFVLAHREFNTLMANFPDIRDSVLEALAERVRRTDPAAD
jgi:CRP-like cAMP-binding protein